MNGQQERIDDAEEDGFLVWNELGQQQSREIQQHLAATTAPGSLPVPVARRLLHSVWQQTAEEASRISSVFVDAARGAIQEQKQHQYHYDNDNDNNNNSSNNNSNTHYLNDFGLQHEENELLEDHQQDDFVLLPPHLRNIAQKGDWGAAADLDVYFSSLYSYYYHRGMTVLVGKGVVDLITLIFTLILSVFLFLYVDWSKLALCTGESTCQANFDAYIIHSPFSRHSAWWSIMVVLYCLVFSSYAFFSVWSFLSTLRQAYQAKWVFEERLGIAPRKLQGGAVDWDKDVVMKLVDLQKTGAYRVTITATESLDALHIAHRIMRKENFIIALINQGILDLDVYGMTLFSSSLEVCKAQSMIESTQSHTRVISGVFTFAY
jgi:hypothetical protein